MRYTWDNVDQRNLPNARLEMGQQLGYPPSRRARDALELKEGDEIEVRLAGSRAFDVDLDKSRQWAMERIRAARWKLPPGWKFDRDEANSR